MNDKQQLAAMGEHLSDQQPMCLAKRVEELEALLREAQPYVKDCADWGGRHSVDLRDAIDDVLGVVMATQQTVPEGWRLVPVEPTPEMLDEGLNRLNTWGFNTPECIYNAMLSAAPAPEEK